MLHKKNAKKALFPLLAGLLLVTLTPIPGRYVQISDGLRGALTGIGLSLEVISFFMIDRDKNQGRCRMR